MNKHIETEMVSIFQKFTNDELAEMKDAVVENNHQITSLKTEKAEVTKKFNDKIKALDNSNAILVKKVRDKGAIVEVECYGEPDYDRNVMVYIDKETDEVVNERTLYPHERQTTIFSTIKTGTDGEN